MTPNHPFTGRSPDYHSYLLRLWRDDDATPAHDRQDDAPWRASLECPHTGQRMGFSGLDALFEHLRRECAPRRQSKVSSAVETG
jgi:hypothetical protein